MLYWRGKSKETNRRREIITGRKGNRLKEKKEEIKMEINKERYGRNRNEGRKER
jgi:hypothetical protein